MEDDLPFKCYTEEDELLPDSLAGEVFYRQSIIEQLIPVSLIMLHVALLYFYYVQWL